jgi:hypothetical protein
MTLMLRMKTDFRSVQTCVIRVICGLFNVTQMMLLVRIKNGFQISETCVICVLFSVTQMTLILRIKTDFRSVQTSVISVPSGSI